MKKPEAIKWKVKTVKIKDLKDYERNPRFMTAKQAKDLQDSIEQYGLPEKPVINLDMTLIGGHQRKNLISEDGYTEIEVMVPDRLLNDKEVADLNIRLNKNTGSWDYEHNAYQRFQDWRDAVRSGILKTDRKQAHQEKVEEAGGEAGLARKELETMEHQRDRMKLVSRIHKAYLKKGEKALEGTDLLEGEKETIRTYVTDRSWEPHPYAPYQLTNIGARIRNKRDRLKLLERKEELAESDTAKNLYFEGGYVTWNYEADRIQIIHEEKPEQETIDTIKSYGFRWSRRYTAWQRQITHNANRAVHRLISKLGYEISAVPLTETG